VHATRVGRYLDGDTGALLIEEEPFSATASRWAVAACRRDVPFGVQVAETRARRLPAPVAYACRQVLEHASFVIARSPAAADLARHWGARQNVVVVPHSVGPHPARVPPDGAFTVAFVGRLVEEKGIEDLLGAVQRLDGATKLLVAGDGPLAHLVLAAGPSVEWLGGLAHEHVASVYERAHVTCVPSRTTSTWEEQFGRVIVESLSSAVPVIATATGEIPWVVSRTGGARLVPQRDPGALAAAIASDAADPGGTAARGRTGRDGARLAFSHEAAAEVLAAVVARVTGE
jgi:glycosyltransferase involved in cell wall biosynthesis